MKNGKIVIVRLWHRYHGKVPSTVPVLLSFDPQKYQTICVYLMRNSWEKNIFEKYGWKVFYLSNKKFFRMFNLSVIWKLVRILKREKVDVIHCHMHQATVYGTIAAKIAGVPVIFSHVHGLNRSRSFKRKFINKIILKHVNKVLTVGEGVREDVLHANSHILPDKVISVGNAIDYNHFNDIHLTKHEAKKRLSLDPDSFVFGTIGRFAPTKGSVYLIQAFKEVLKQIPSAKLVLVGDGRLKEQLRTEVRNMGLDEAVRFLGQRDDIPQLLKAMDVFVLPSLAEGLPRSLLEAMAVGVPCVGTNVAGILEVMDNGKYGLTVPPKDKDALARAMVEIASKSSSELQKIVEDAKERILGSYTHSVVSKRVEAVYHSECHGITN
jgi:glycosyltransferase involved in cell wall biosynthesis